MGIKSDNRTLELTQEQLSCLLRAARGRREELRDYLDRLQSLAITDAGAQTELDSLEEAIKRLWNS
jgi:hypothetical protein